MTRVEELIAAPAGPARRTTWIVTLTVTLSLCALIGTGAVEVLMPPSKRRLIGDEREEAARAALGVSWWDGSRARAIETDFRLRGRVRREMAPYWSVLMLKLGDAPGRSLVVGRDDFLFYRERIKLDPGRRVQGAHLLARVFGAVARCLAAHRSELIVVPLPRKSVVAGSKLPLGLDATPDYDRIVIEAFEWAGVRTVDLAPRWTGAAAGGAYLRHDSHWSRTGVLAFADEVSRQVPELPRHTTMIEYADGALKETAGLLADAGIVPGAPPYRWAHPQTEPEFVLLPPSRERRIDVGEEPAEILLAGSSFSQGFSARAILAWTLQTPVMDGSLKGRLPLDSLGDALFRRAPEEFPPFIIAEFPIHQAATITPGTESTMRACFTILNHLRREELERPLSPTLFPGATRRAPKLNQPLLQYPGGTLLSSGDGVLAIRVKFESDSMTRWRFASSGTTLSIRIPPGRHTRVLPIIESDEFLATFWLAPLNLAALVGNVSAEVVTHMDRRLERPLAVTSTARGTYRHMGPDTVGPHDALLLTWSDPGRGPFAVEAIGRDVDGLPRARRWSFKNSQGARAAAFTLGHLVHGQLDEVMVTGVGQVVSVSLAPLVTTPE